MVALPTLDVTQAQADRMVAAYGSAANYRQWLAEQIREYVTTFEMLSYTQAQALERDAKRAQIKTELTVT